MAGQFISVSYTFAPRTYKSWAYGYDHTVFILTKEPTELRKKLNRLIGAAGRHAKRESVRDHLDAMLTAMGSTIATKFRGLTRKMGKHESEEISTEAEYEGRRRRVEEASSEEGAEAEAEAA